jgi:tungstate transport system substrate-binding protein
VKKIFYLFINLLIFAGVLLAITGCSSNTETETSSTPTTPTPDNPEVILATTTSTQDSGLLDVLVPMFEEQTGYHVKTVAVGTGAALAMGEQGEADVLLVHAPTSELPLMENGDCISRKLVMHNDFVIVGPPSDPAGISSTSDAVAALKAIADSESIFISRGDDSGTNKMELSLWSKTSVDPSGQSWYQESGQGMGATLTITSEKQAYTLTDRATYLATQANLELEIFTQGDPLLLNIYHVMQVNPAKNDLINGAGGEAFVDFMIDPATQAVIKDFGVEKYGQPLFFPDADKTEADLGSV